MEHENTDTQVKKLLMDSDRQGRAVDYGVYSKMMRRAFEHVKELRMEKFKFSDICGAYVKAGALPPGAAPSSFRKAFRNEEKRRARSLELEKRVSDGHKVPPAPDVARSDKQAVTHDTGAHASERKTPELNVPVMNPPRVMHLPNRTAARGAGLEVRPDNTFTIRPIDTSDLPEL